MFLLVLSSVQSIKRFHQELSQNLINVPTEDIFFIKSIQSDRRDEHQISCDTDEFVTECKASYVLVRRDQVSAFRITRNIPCRKNQNDELI